MDESLQQLRICLVAYMISRQATGLSTYVADLVTHLLDEGHQVTVLATDCGYRGTKGGELPTIDSRASTLVQVIASDRSGLLYRICSRFSYQGCNIEIALIDTEGQMAIDVFYLTSNGRKLTPGKQEELKADLLEELQATT